MAEHFKVISQFEKITNKDLRHISSFSASRSEASDVARVLGSGGSVKCLRADQRSLLLQMAIKVADLGHTTLLEAEHVTWVQRLETEFFGQGDAERERSICVSPLSDRTKLRNGPAAGENQIGFFDVICKPLLSAWVKVFPECSSLLDQINANLRYWQIDAENLLNEIVLTAN
mmetsp:Transcript_8192/g.11047  ORF Transcript_8192/g.11047 Transcript_8192/m.11047 type:complete len:173 (-) Transcript_8192:162-680(-)